MRTFLLILILMIISLLTSKAGQIGENFNPLDKVVFKSTLKIITINTLFAVNNNTVVEFNLPHKVIPDTNDIIIIISANKIDIGIELQSTTSGLINSNNYYQNNTLKKSANSKIHYTNYPIVCNIKS